MGWVSGLGLLSCGWGDINVDIKTLDGWCTLKSTPGYYLPIIFLNSSSETIVSFGKSSFFSGLKCLSLVTR